MNSFFKLSKKSVLLAAVLIVFGSCKDAWKEHYSFKETESKYPVAKLAETLGSIDGFDMFCKVLEETKMCDKHGKPLDMTYMDLLNEDQFLTVWAPSNSSLTAEEWAPYIKSKRDKSAAEHKDVGEKFIENHIARFKHSVGAGSEPKIYMLNGKTYVSEPDAISGNAYHGDDKNIRCSNGVLHCIDGHMDYLPSLYERVTQTWDEYNYRDLFGAWLDSFMVKELDPFSSVAQGFNDNGEMVYVDSVMIESNVLLNRFGRINVEDSTYALVLPTPELWRTTYNRIKQYYKYAEKDLNNDSLQTYYTRITMLTDMFFNINDKANYYLPDSVFSTRYDAVENRSDKKPYHIFSKPYDKVNGLFGSSIDSIDCSNGTIYIVDKWPFVDTLTFLRRIKAEAEDYNLGNNWQQSLQTVSNVGKNTLEVPIQVRRISRDQRPDWEAKFYIEDNLRGKYAVKLVVAPDAEHKRPNYIHPVIAYDSPTNFDSIMVDSQTVEWVEIYGYEFEMTVDYYMSNDTSKIDTLLLGIVDLPYCNYDMRQPCLSITLSSGVIDDNAHLYSSEMWMDAIILDPVVE